MEALVLIDPSEITATATEKAQEQAITAEMLFNVALGDDDAESAIIDAGIHLALARRIKRTGGSEQIDTYLRDAAAAKATLQKHSTGWSRISTDQIRALGFVADLMLVDIETVYRTTPPKPKTEAL